MSSVERSRPDRAPTVLPADDALGLDPAREEQGPAVAAWLALHEALVFDPVRARRCIEMGQGDPRAALVSSGLQPRLIAPADGMRQLDRLAALGVRLVPFADGAYPPPLAAIADAPPLLFALGRLETLTRPCVAVVGARAATAMGRQLARELGEGLAAAGYVVVSGLARGIDAEAHRGALAAGGLTIAVQACGIDRVYPAEHRGLREEVAEHGVVLSELPLSAPPLAHYFPMRNRLISGLARGVVVVEARARSGSLITARCAADQGREVMALPGALGTPTAVGTNRLIRDGAGVVLEWQDILDRVGPPGPGPAPSANTTGPAGERVESGVERVIARILADGPLDRDALARRSGLASEALAPALLRLELAGRVFADRAGRLHWRRARARLGPLGSA